MAGWQDAPLVTAAAATATPAWASAPLADAQSEPSGPSGGMLMRQQFAQPAAREAKSFSDYLDAGWQQSVSGLVKRGGVPEVAVTPDTPWYGRAVAGAVSLAGDAPAMLAGGLGATVATAGRGGAVVAGAGAFAAPMMIRQALMDAYTKGAVTGAADFVQRSMDVAWEGFKGGVTGAATVATGGAVKALTAGLPTVAAVALPTAAEIATMTTVGRALEGHLPEPQDFLDAAVLLGGLKGVTVTAAKLRTIYAKTGVAPQQVLADAAVEPMIAAEFRSGLHGSPNEFGEFDPSKSGSGSSKGLTDEATAKIVGKLAPSDNGIPTPYKALAEEQTARAIVPGDKAAEVAAKPFADELPQAAGEPAKPTHVNYNLIATAEDTKLAMARLSEVYEAEIQTQRRGTVTWEQTSNEAGKILSDTLGGVDMKLIMPREPGTPAGAAEILARKQLAVGAAESMMAARDDLLAKGAEATSEDKLHFLASIERASVIQAEFLGARAEVGRALNILKNTSNDARRAQQMMDLISSEKKQPLSPQTAKFVSNTIFTESKVLAARALLKSKLGTLNAGLDPETLNAGLTIAGAHIEAGVRDFASFSKAMVADLGDAIKPHLQELFDKSMENIKRENPEIISRPVDQAAAADAMQMYGDPIKLAEMMKDIDNPAGAMKFAKDATKATTWEKVVEAWKAGILSGLVTHVANGLGNGSFLAMRPAIDALAAIGGTVINQKNRVSLAEPFARAIGDLQGAKDGLRMAAHAFMTEETPSKTEQFRVAIGGDADSTPLAQFIGKNIVRLPFRALSAADVFFSTMNERGELYAQATREAVARDLNPLTKEFREAVVSMVQNPTEAMAESAHAAALRFTFNTPSGPVGQAVSGFVRTPWFGTQVAPLQMIVPFIRTPMNMMEEMFRLSPMAPLVGSWRADIAKGGAERAKALAEISMGTAIAAVAVSFAADGTLTGAGEPDAGKKRIQEAAGIQPYSWKIGNTYYNFQRLQPLGTLLGMSVDMYEIWDHMTEEEKDKVPKMIAVAFANAVTNQTFLQGITNLVRATSEPGRFGPKMAQQLAGSVVPAIVAQPTAMNDPMAREVNSILDAIKSRVPGWRDTLLPKIDVFGEPIMTKERLGVISPVTEMLESADKVRSEAARLGISASDAPKKVHLGRGTGKIGEVELTPEQRNKYAVASGKLAHEVLTGIVNQPWWDELSVLEKRKAYQRVFEKAHMVGAMSTMSGEVRDALVQQLSVKMTKELEPEEVTQ